MHDLTQGVAKAIEAFGSQTALAKALGIERSAISQWTKKHVPIWRALEIEKISKGAVALHDMRPDVWPAPKKRRA